MIYVKNNLKKLLYQGVGKGYSHMLVIWDGLGYAYAVAYVKDNQDVNEVCANYQRPNEMMKVDAVYNYGMDLEEQLNEVRPYHLELDEKTKIEEYKKSAELMDMHTHTCYSDGELNPNQLFEMAISKGIKTISITDHDTLLAYKNINNDSNIQYLGLIPGIELTAKTDIGRMHILGYGFNLDDKKLNSRMKELQQNSINFVLAMIHQLNKDYGITIDSKDIAELITTNRNIGRPDIARLLVEYGIVKTRDEAFKIYLVNIYEKTRGITNKLSPGECIELIKWAGGIPILAHPPTLKRNDKDLLILIKELVSMGLGGLEVYHSNNTKEQEQYYMQIVQDLNLLYSGGSDYHGINVNPDVELGTGRGNLKIKELSVVNYIKNRK